MRNSKDDRPDPADVMTMSRRVSAATAPVVVVHLVMRMLREAFEGPPGPWTYFIDTSLGTGVFGTIAELNAGQASQKAGPNNTTIAGHLHHLNVTLALSRQALRGDSTTHDRGLSWTVSTVDDAAWLALRAELQRAYESMLVAVSSHPTWGEDALGVAFGAIAHTAYHLGAIRQRLTPHGSNP
jgi:hypothetical protein